MPGRVGVDREARLGGQVIRLHQLGSHGQCVLVRGRWAGHGEVQVDLLLLVTCA
jgi:hypothetical protein